MGLPQWIVISWLAIQLIVYYLSDGKPCRIKTMKFKHAFFVVAFWVSTLWWGGFFSK